jgi:hypothetical protein
MEFILDVVVTMHTEWHDAVEREFIDAAGEDQVLDFAEFKRACAAMKPAAAPSEDSFAFMYWRALKSAAAGRPTTRFRFARSWTRCVAGKRRWSTSLKVRNRRTRTRGEGEGRRVSRGRRVSCDDESRVRRAHGAASFLWHCGIVNQLGVRARREQRVDGGEGGGAEARRGAEQRLAVVRHRPQPRGIESASDERERREAARSVTDSDAMSDAT